MKKLVDLWCERFEHLSTDSRIKYIFIFENRGEIVGVTMPHPHGQIYGYPYIPKKIEVELSACKKYFNKNNRCLNDGTNSFEDYIQQFIYTWNYRFSSSRPIPVVDRVFFDKLIIVDDNKLPIGGNANDPHNAWYKPDISDKTVDFMWGFPSTYTPTIDDTKDLNLTLLNPIFEFMIHESSHARYLVDTYGMQIWANQVKLKEDIDEKATVINLDDYTGRALNESFKCGYVIIDKEIIKYKSIKESKLYDCERGVNGTKPVSHITGSKIIDGVISLSEDGNAIIGTYLPNTWGIRQGDERDIMYGTGMGHYQGYGEFSALTLNRIAGWRARGGNFNAPSVIGEFLNYLPQNNILEFKYTDNTPISNADITVYRAQRLGYDWYGKKYDYNKEYMSVYKTDSNGKINLEQNPFSKDETVTHYFGYSNSVILIKIQIGDKKQYLFWEITKPVIEYMKGNQKTANYIIELDRDLQFPYPPLFIV